jgi:HAD superfamily hydrolase (TIGR01509 family)
VPVSPDRLLDAVLLDFHGTLATTRDPVTWLGAALVNLGVTLDRGKLTVLADRVAASGGLPGVPGTVRVPPHLAGVRNDRDQSYSSRRAAYRGVVARVATDIEGLADAVYERVLEPAGWTLYADALSTISALRAAGISVGVLSNIGFDIRPHLNAWGLGDLPATLSYEVGRTKPDPKIFLAACAAVGAAPERTLMVGDTPKDAGAVTAGLRALIVPAAPVGQANGLSSILRLALPDLAGQ